ncbi:hypothetical protein KIN20_008054 [Parelaphostrongylus tenuis]|uniref:Uncharacterized protein n=1 Tax=Parelaphostrongylus tenuis TaxID=148309 RepID=A0AAD5M470_PARTN|nr:hypothetical protein KIN20_008054 [Parelaphostrongylus tenuis]
MPKEKVAMMEIRVAAGNSQESDSRDEAEAQRLTPAQWVVGRVRGHDYAPFSMSVSVVFRAKHFLMPGSWIL